MRRGIFTTEFWVVAIAIAFVAGSAWHGGNAEHSLAVGGAAGVYAAARTLLKRNSAVLVQRGIESLLKGPAMSTLASGLATSLETKFIDANTSLAPLQPELDAAINSVAALAQKAIVVYGAQLIAKLIATPAAPAKTAAAAVPAAK